MMPDQREQSCEESVSPGQPRETSDELAAAIAGKAPVLDSELDPARTIEDSELRVGSEQRLPPWHTRYRQTGLNTPRLGGREE
jgi:hypothetical protein